MKPPYRVVLLAPLLLGVLLSGCFNSGTPLQPETSAGGSDQAEITSEISRNPELVEDGLYETEDRTTLATPTGPKGPIEPLSYWRTIANVERFVEISFKTLDAHGRPITAVATVHKILTGRFNILVGDLPEDSTRTVIHKRLSDHWVRRVLLHRIQMGDSDRWRWALIGTSGVEVTSKDAETKIVSLRLQTAAWDSTILNPLEIFRLRRILKFAPGTEVTLTATTLRNDDVVVLHHRHHRFRFLNNGDNTYTGVWKVGEDRGLQHFGVNALSNGTLYDDEVPYDSHSWILPYVVTGNEIADLGP